MPNLMENRLLWSMLSAAGQDIGAGNPIGANVDKVTQQSIATQSYTELLSKILSGGGKVNMDRDNVSIKAPNAVFQSEGGQLPQEKIGLQGPGGTEEATGASGTPNLQTVAAPQGGSSQDLLSTLLRGNISAVNPSGSPLGDLTSADLAGLTTQDVSQALRFKFAQDEVGRQSINDVFENMHRLSRLKLDEARVGVAGARELRLLQDSMQKAPLAVPGLGDISLDEWEKLDSKTKAYSYYAFDANRRGEGVVSYNDFVQQADPGSLAGYYDLAKKDPEFEKFYFASKKAGAAKISIGEKAQSKQMINWVNKLSNMQPNVEKHMETSAVQDKLIQHDIGSADERGAKAKERVKFIEQTISDNGGKITDVSYDPENGVMIWTVSNPLGERETISYGIGN